MQFSSNVTNNSSTSTSTHSINNLNSINQQSFITVTGEKIKLLSPPPPPPEVVEEVVEEIVKESIPIKENISHLYPPAPIYPTETPILHTSPIKILSTPTQGRGIYASKNILPGTLIDISPVLLLTKEEYYGNGSIGEGKGVEGSVLRGYVFTWTGKESGMALALGIGSLFNHSINPNVTFELNTKGYYISYKTFKLIKEGEELCIFYGHQTRFDDDPSPSLSLSLTTTPTTTTPSTPTNLILIKPREESIWGGLEIMTENLEKEKKLKEEEIILFEDLNWNKVTQLINDEDLILETFECWVLDIPAKYVPLALNFMREHTQDPNATHHLKRTKSPIGIPRTSESILSFLLFPVLNSIDVPTILPSSPLGFLNLEAKKVKVAKNEPKTFLQVKEWGKNWPLQLFQVKEGTQQEKIKGWSKIKRDWIEKEIRKCWESAKEAGKKGEHPIACHVTDTFEPTFHSTNLLPKTLIRSHDTRKSTNNILSHSISNAIDAVSVLDRLKIRPSPTYPSFPLPYLLTGMTVFISHEPCLVCSMSLLHSRISNLFFIKKSIGSGGCGSLFHVHEEDGLNHKFEVWEWKLNSNNDGNGNGDGNGEGEGDGEGIGIGLDVFLDP